MAYCVHIQTIRLGLQLTAYFTNREVWNYFLALKFICLIKFGWYESYSFTIYCAPEWLNRKRLPNYPEITSLNHKFLFDGFSCENQIQNNNINNTLTPRKACLLSWTLGHQNEFLFWHFLWSWRVYSCTREIHTSTQANDIFTTVKSNLYISMLLLQIDGC